MKVHLNSICHQTLLQYNKSLILLKSKIPHLISILIKIIIVVSMTLVWIGIISLLVMLNHSLNPNQILDGLSHRQSNNNNINNNNNNNN